MIKRRMQLLTHASSISLRSLTLVSSGRSTAFMFSSFSQKSVSTMRCQINKLHYRQVLWLTLSAGTVNYYDPDHGEIRTGWQGCRFRWIAAVLFCLWFPIWFMEQSVQIFSIFSYSGEHHYLSKLYNLHSHGREEFLVMLPLSPCIRIHAFSFTYNLRSNFSELQCTIRHFKMSALSCRLKHISLLSWEL